MCLIGAKQDSKLLFLFLLTKRRQQQRWCCGMFVQQNNCRPVNRPLKTVQGKILWVLEVYYSYIKLSGGVHDSSNPNILFYGAHLFFQCSYKYASIGFSRRNHRLYVTPLVHCLLFKSSEEVCSARYKQVLTLRRCKHETNSIIGKQELMGPLLTN